MMRILEAVLSEELTMLPVTVTYLYCSLVLMLNHTLNWVVT